MVYSWKRVVSQVENQHWLLSTKSTAAWHESFKSAVLYAMSLWPQFQQWLLKLFLWHFQKQILFFLPAALIRLLFTLCVKDFSFKKDQNLLAIDLFQYVLCKRQLVRMTMTNAIWLSSLLIYVRIWQNSKNSIFWIWARYNSKTKYKFTRIWIRIQEKWTHVQKEHEC